MKGFKVYKLATSSSPVPATCRRDFYQVYLFSGPCLLHRADQTLPYNGGPYLCVGNPYPIGLLPAAGPHLGYACLFTEAFVRENGHFGGLEQRGAAARPFGGAAAPR